MEERRFRIGSLFEWIVAAAGVLALVWMLSVPVQRMLGPRVEAAPDAPTALPPGVPAGSTSVPVVLMLDGREIRHGELHSRLEQLFPTSGTKAPVHRSKSEFGERQTRTYEIDGATFYVVCERTEAGGPLRVSGIFVP